MNQPNTTIEAELIYAINNGEPIYYEIFTNTEIGEKNSVADHQLVTIHDARGMSDEFSLEKHGFELTTHQSALKDFSDEGELRRIYYPEIEQLVLDYTGAARVLVFDHTFRHGDEATRQERQIRKPVMGVHNDYTEWSAPKRVRDMLPDEAEDLLQRRYAIVQVWRATNGVVHSQPLAIADARSIASDDLIPVQRRSPERLGETYSLAYNTAHQWYYFSKMKPDEALIFKVFDSSRDGRARFTAHTAFDDPTTPLGAPPRESIEMRLLVFY